MSERPLRVALVCPYSLSRPGGVQGQVSGLARAYGSLGHHAVVLAPTDGEVEITGLDPADVVSVGRSMGLRANGSIAPVSINPLSSLRARRVVSRGGFDVAHIHEPLAPGPGFGCLFAPGVPKVGTFHRCGSSPGYRALGVVARGAARRLQVRCAVSPDALATAQRAVGGIYEVMGNGVELERFAGALPWPTDGPTVMFVGRHEPRKGLSELLDAFTSARADTPCTLWVAGHGPETDRLRARFPADERLVWLGALNDDELASRLAGAHIVCAPSLYGESFGVVLLEAMAARCAVVASDLSAYAAVVGTHGHLVPVGDAVALATALRRTVAEAATGTGLGAPRALDAAAEHAATWSMEGLARRYVEIFERLARPSPSP